MKKVTITKDYKGFTKGQIVVVSDAIYNKLNGEGVIGDAKKKNKSMKAEECADGKCSPKKAYKTKVVSPEK